MPCSCTSFTVKKCWDWWLAGAFFHISYLALCAKSLDTPALQLPMACCIAQALYYTLNCKCECTAKISTGKNARILSPFRNHGFFESFLQDKICDMCKVPIVITIPLCAGLTHLCKQRKQSFSIDEVIMAIELSTDKNGNVSWSLNFKNIRFNSSSLLIHIRCNFPFTKTQTTYFCWPKLNAVFSRNSKQFVFSQNSMLFETHRNLIFSQTLSDLILFHENWTDYTDTPKFASKQESSKNERGGPCTASPCAT